MTPFNFRFQKILDLKENEKDFAKIEMANAVKQEAEGHQKNEAIYRKIMAAERLKREKQRDGVHISELITLENYIYQLQEQLRLSDRELKLLQRNVTKSQHHLQLKAQEEQTWDHLKQHERTVFEKQRKVAEQNFFDEVTRTRFYRQSKMDRAERR